MRDKYYQQKVIGAFINRLREELKLSLPLETLLVLKGMEGSTKTVALLRRKIRTLGELADMDYGELLSILGQKRAEYLILVTGLYNLRRNRKVTSKDGGDHKEDVATTEIVSQ